MTARPSTGDASRFVSDREWDGVQLPDHVYDHRGVLLGWSRAICHAWIFLGVLGRRSAPRWAALTGAAIVADAALARRARDPAKYAGPARVAADVVEVAAWAGSTATTDPISSRPAGLLAWPTSLEEAYRRGRAADLSARSVLAMAAAPVLSSAAVAAARRASGFRRGAGVIGWDLIGVVGGYRLGRNRRENRRRGVQSHADWAADRIVQSFFRGAHDVTMDESDEASPHNLKRDLMILDHYGSATALPILHDMQAQKAAVLEDSWEAGRYLGHLTRGFRLEPPTAWSIRLTTAQYAAATTLLEHASAELAGGGADAGIVEVMNEPEARRVGGRVGLVINGRRTELPAEIAPQRWHADPAPIACFLGALWKLSTTFSPPSRVPLPVATLGAAVDTLIGLSFRYGTPTDDQVHLPVFAMLGNGAAFLALTRLLDDGPTHALGNATVASAGILMTAYWHRMRRRDRILALSGVVGLTVLYVAVSPVKVPLAARLGEAIVPWNSVLAAIGIGARLDREALEYARLLTERTDELAARAYDDGAEEECSSLLRMIDRGATALRETERAMPAALGEEIGTRLEEARRWVMNRSAS